MRKKYVQGSLLEEVTLERTDMVIYSLADYILNVILLVIVITKIVTQVDKTFPFWVNE